MVLSCNYDKLVLNLQAISNIVEDPMAAEDDKSIIFHFIKKNGVAKVRLIGVSPVITFKRDMDMSDYTLTLEDDELDENGERFISIKSKDLLSYLNTYKSLRKTKVDEVIFEPVRDKIKCTVIESYRYTEAELKKIQQELSWNPEAHDPREDKLHSQWMFQSIIIQPKKMPFINLQAPETELEDDKGTNIFKLLAQSMIPIVENSTTTFGYITFDEKFIVAFHQAFVAMMVNVIPGETFKGVRLSYRILSFINKIISGESDVKYAKTEKHIYFKTENSEAFVTYDTKLTPYETQRNLYSTERMISVDRGYLKDSIKRFYLMNDSIEFTIDGVNSTIKLANSRYSQELPVLQIKNMEDLGTFHFKIMPVHLDGALIGGDDTFAVGDTDENAEHNGETYIYYNKEKSVICLGDVTGGWFTVLSVSVY